MSSHRTYPCATQWLQCAQRDPERTRELICLRAVNTQSNSPTNSSTSCRKTLSYVTHGSARIDRTLMLMTPQTDSTRSRQQELQYQERLTAELEKLREQETQNFSKFSETLSGEPEQPSEPSLIEKISDATSSNATLAEKQRQKEMTRNTVTEEVEQLRAKLANRKKLEQVDADVGKAKDAVIACLRTNDRRPLDCWQEIETFKKEVGRLEKQFVEKTIR
jgi:altered-inheritance-of-mitochondria protein 13